MKNNQKIDFVVTWVDGSDPKWQKEKLSYLGQEVTQEQIDASVTRYRDFGHMRYWFRAVEKYAPWVNKIHFVTWGHLPEWINTDAPKLNIVRHSDFIPEEYLPTFSSHPIELNLHRIDGLSEQFVYFNDDFVLTAPVQPKDFFVNGLPCDCLKEDPIEFKEAGQYNQILINDLLFASKHFARKKCRKEKKGKWFSVRAPKAMIRNILTCLMRHEAFFGFSIHHLPQAYLVKSLKQVWDLDPELLCETSSHRFRNDKDVSQLVFKYWQLLSGTFMPYNKDRFGKVFDVSSQLREICECISNKRYKAICINDSEQAEFEEVRQTLTEAFEMVLSEKSSFEI